MTKKKTKSNQSLENTMAMIKSLRGRELRSKDFKEECRKFKVRDGLLKYCVERGLCEISRHKFQNDGKHNLYKFAHNLNVTPRLVKFILDDRANYLKELASKRAFNKKDEKFNDDKREKSLKRESLKVITEREKIASQKSEDKNKHFSITQIIESVRRDERDKMLLWVDSLQRELEELDKTCLTYLDHIDSLNQRISELESEKEKVRDVFFNLQMAKLKTESLQ